MVYRRLEPPPQNRWSTGTDALGRPTLKMELNEVEVDLVHHALCHFVARAWAGDEVRDVRDAFGSWLDRHPPEEDD